MRGRSVKQRYGPDADFAKRFIALSEEVVDGLKYLNLTNDERHFYKEWALLWYRVKQISPSILMIAEEMGICERQGRYIAASLEAKGYLKIVRPSGRTPEFDWSGLLAAVRKLRGKKQKQKRAEKAAAPRPRLMRPAMAASAAPRPRSASAHLAPIKAPDQRASIEASVAPALPEECSAVLVAFLDALPMQQEQDLPDLVALVAGLRGGLDDAALLVALQRASDQAIADIARKGKQITSPVGLLHYKIKASIRHAHKEAAEEARRAAEQEQEEAAMLASMLAGLNDDGQRFYAIGSAHDWQSFSYRRLWDGWKDWLYFAYTYGEDKGALYAALASINLAEEAPDLTGPIEADQGEQERQADQRAPIKAPDLAEAMQEQEEAAPAHIEAPTSPAQEPIRPARIEVLRPPRFWQLATEQGFPHVEILADDSETEIVLDGPESWQQFRESSSAAEQRRAERTLGKMERGVIASAGTRPPGRYRLGDRPVIEADQRPIEDSAPDAPARKKRPILDTLTRFANDSAAGLL